MGAYDSLIGYMASQKNPVLEGFDKTYGPAAQEAGLAARTATAIAAKQSDPLYALQLQTAKARLQNIGLDAAIKMKTLQNDNDVPTRAADIIQQNEGDYSMMVDNMLRDPVLSKSKDLQKWLGVAAKSAKIDKDNTAAGLDITRTRQYNNDLKFLGGTLPAGVAADDYTAVNSAANGQRIKQMLISSGIPADRGEELFGGLGIDPSNITTKDVQNLNYFLEHAKGNLSNEEFAAKVRNEQPDNDQADATKPISPTPTVRRAVMTAEGAPVEDRKIINTGGLRVNNMNQTAPSDEVTVGGQSIGKAKVVNYNDFEKAQKKIEAGKNKIDLGGAPAMGVIPQIESVDQFDKLPSGTKYVYKGKTLIKK